MAADKTYLTWRYNSHGHIEIWQGRVHPDLIETEADLYLQDDTDVQSFLEIYGLSPDNFGIGYWNQETDHGYF